MKKLIALAAFATAAALPASAAAAPPKPFGHSCAAQNGTLFCPTANDAERVPSFDGVPIDVDVTLPPSGDGPFPAIVLMHGWGGNKGSFQTDSPEGNGGGNYHYNNVYFAQRRYAVITASARGFGRSCGAASSRAAAGCARGWVRLSDQRYEVRDTQHLLGLLADQGVVRPRAIGVSGISYGGIQSMNLARLRDRVRLRNGRFRRWRSPEGTPLRIAAAYPRWGSFDLTYSLQPNGHYLDSKPFGAAQAFARPGFPRRPTTTPSTTREPARASTRLAADPSAPTSAAGRRSPTGVNRRVRTRSRSGASSPGTTAPRACRVPARRCW
jgi:pimeloyl-ACP methyl ester carboxylesterase